MQPQENATAVELEAVRSRHCIEHGTSPLGGFERSMWSACSLHSQSQEAAVQHAQHSIDAAWRSLWALACARWPTSLAHTAVSSSQVHAAGHGSEHAKTEQHQHLGPVYSAPVAVSPAVVLPLPRCTDILKVPQSSSIALLRRQLARTIGRLFWPENLVRCMGPRCTGRVQGVRCCLTAVFTHSDLSGCFYGKGFKSDFEANMA